MALEKNTSEIKSIQESQNTKETAESRQTNTDKLREFSIKNDEVLKNIKNLNASRSEKEGAKILNSKLQDLEEDLLKKDSPNYKKALKDADHLMKIAELQLKGADEDLSSLDASVEKEKKHGVEELTKELNQLVGKELFSVNRYQIMLGNMVLGEYIGEFQIKTNTNLGKLHISVIEDGMEIFSIELEDGEVSLVKSQYTGTYYKRSVNGNSYRTETGNLESIGEKNHNFRKKTYKEFMNIQEEATEEEQSAPEGEKISNYSDLVNILKKSGFNFEVIAGNVLTLNDKFALYSGDLPEETYLLEDTSVDGKKQFTLKDKYGDLIFRMAIDEESLIFENSNGLIDEYSFSNTPIYHYQDSESNYGSK